MGKQVVLPLFSGALPRPVTVPGRFHACLAPFAVSQQPYYKPSHYHHTTNAHGSDRLAVTRRYTPSPSGFAAKSYLVFFIILPRTFPG